MIESAIDLQLPDIRIMNKIGEGGMSCVWKAMDLKRNKVVAVKVLNKDLTASVADLEQFKAEEKVMETIDHPGIVKSYEIRHTDALWYFIMEYVDGYNFGQLLARKQHLKEADCLLICESVATALDYAWNEHGIVHCDIKPENIMINSDGQVKLTDLGICHTFQFLKNEKVPVPDHVLGTPAYISPEQVYGDVELDCRADIYSLAASLYHLATGQTLFPGLDPETVMRAQCSDSFRARDPRLIRPRLSEGFCQLLEAMLVKDRDYRVPTWSDVFSMCGMIEKGQAFKPRPSDAVSTLLLGPSPDARYDA